MCPVVLTRGSDQTPVSTKFEMRGDDNVLRQYGRMLIELSGAIPDGIVCFFVSYSYMDQIVSKWNEMGILQELMAQKLVFIETVDVVETTLALDNFRCRPTLHPLRQTANSVCHADETPLVQKTPAACWQCKGQLRCLWGLLQTQAEGPPSTSEHHEAQQYMFNC